MTIKVAAVCALVLGLPLLGGCLGPEGNPDGMPYATDADGAIAVKPQTVGVETYDPNAPAPPFADETVNGINPDAPPGRDGSAAPMPPPSLAVPRHQL